MQSGVLLLLPKAPSCTVTRNKSNSCCKAWRIEQDNKQKDAEKNVIKMNGTVPLNLDGIPSSTDIARINYSPAVPWHEKYPIAKPDEVKCREIPYVCKSTRNNKYDKRTKLNNAYDLKWRRHVAAISFPCRTDAMSWFPRISWFRFLSQDTLTTWNI